jgi:hypothetical protein
MGSICVVARRCVGTAREWHVPALSVAVAQPAPLTLAALPHALLLEVLSRLPVDCRLRCAAVCRAWRTARNERSLWRRLDLSPATGGLARTASDGLLRAAAARAAGHLETLDVSGCHDISYAALLAVVTASSASLRELHVHGGGLRFTWRPPAQLEALLRAAPGVRACAASVFTCEVAVARVMLRAEPPFAALRLESLNIGNVKRVYEADAVLELTADLAACTFLRELRLCCAALDAPAALDALVDAAFACRLRALRLVECRLSAASAPALARLLGGGALVDLELRGKGGNPLLDAPAAALLAHALRASSTLTALKLWNVQLWHDPDVATALLGALTGHASLRTLDLFGDGADSAAAGAAVGAALGALVAANAPALTKLDVTWCRLGDAGLHQLFDALPANTHLRTLNCGGNTTDAFACDVLLPAVRANGSLRQLSCTQEIFVPSPAAAGALADAEALVAQRAAC